MEPQKDNRNRIAYSCYYTQSREGEQFVPEHVLSFQLSGTLVLDDGSRQFTSGEGSLIFVRRNQLLKFVKYPPPGGMFRSLSLYLTQDALRAFGMSYGLSAEHHISAEPVIPVEMDHLLRDYRNALLNYQEADLHNQQLVDVKIREGILLLLQACPDLRHVLFDFAAPHKIDLEAFMNKHFHFNVKLDRFAYLTGRSLATFKRDFEYLFHTSLRRWLLQRRLQEAHYLIGQKGRSASDIYLDLGFEDLSHFSFAFKKQFGHPPGWFQRNTGQNG
ncbi:helix-turn-helix domain-containing protein [Taibaiella koreensis]|uniref:helix-turn-helix domain-containing protein n=1 Tax=Taibaiella koreensis TaxID=1268548 RepID=UPI000E59962E|nr:AraC family transcriptional regulator [Taibaiella koreensis]